MLELEVFSPVLPPMITCVEPLLLGLLLVAVVPSSSVPEFSSSCTSLSSSGFVVDPSLFVSLGPLVSPVFFGSSFGSSANTNVPRPINKNKTTANMIPFLLSMKNLPSYVLIIPLFKLKSTTLIIKYVFFVKN